MKNMIQRYGLVMSYKSVPISRNLDSKYEVGTRQDEIMIFDNLADAIDYMYELAEDR